MDKLLKNFKIDDIEEETKTDPRINRGKTQKIYLVNRNVDDKTAKFNIMGTTGNIYEVTLLGSPTCTCPDFTQRQSRCKHIYFMLAKIFVVNDPYQEKFTDKEISDYIGKYKENIEKHNKKYDIGSKCFSVEMKGTDDYCCICLDDILNGSTFVYCKSTCGRCVHTDCYTMVIKKTSKCPYCSSIFKCSEIINPIHLK